MFRTQIAILAIGSRCLEHKLPSFRHIGEKTPVLHGFYSDCSSFPRKIDGFWSTGLKVGDF